MSRVSTFAGSSFSPERMLRSTTAPVSRFLNLVRVNAAPLPGLTNWNSTMVNGFPSINTFKPLRISDVSYMPGHVYLARSAPVKPRFRGPAGARARPDGSGGACRVSHTWGISRRDGRRGALPSPADARPRGVPRRRRAGGADAHRGRRARRG